MTENTGSGAVVTTVPEILYSRCRCLKLPGKLQVFHALCSQEQSTTKDIEVSTNLSLKVVNQALREMEELNLARQIGQSFFFQAEDGIRDLTVTGVQTCALPI